MPSVGRWNSALAKNIRVDTSNFNGILSSADIDVQAALDTIDDGLVGSGVSLVTTNFDGILSATEDTVQKAMDILDDNALNVSGAKAGATAGSQAFTNGISVDTINLNAATEVTFPDGNIDVGVDDSQRGFIWLYGGDATIGGGIRFYGGATADTPDYWDLQASSNQIRLSDASGVNVFERTGVATLGLGGTAFGGPYEITITDGVGVALLGSLSMPDAGKQIWDAAPASDHTATGDQIPISITANDYAPGDADDIMGLLVLEETGGTWISADKDSVNTVGLLALALESGTGTKNVLKRGYARNDTWDFSSGAQLFVGDAGAITDDVSGYTTGDYVQVVGYAVTADVIYFNPSPDFLEVA